MSKIKKIGEVKPNIKKIDKPTRETSELEEEIQESEQENFSDFMSASSSEITPILDAEQPTTQTEIDVREPVKTELPRDEEPQRPSYIQHKEESMDVKYLSQTSSASVTPNLRQENLPMSQPAFRHQPHSATKPLQEDIRDKYKDEISSSSKGERKGMPGNKNTKFI